jgi:hypothetical protein
MQTSIAAKVGALFAAPLMFLGGGAGHVAQNMNGHVFTNGRNVSDGLVCTNLTQNLYYGETDRNTGGQVSELQNFLQAEGNMNGNASGTFNLATLRGVIAFQQAHNISPTGFAGTKTRAEIQSLSCGTSTTSGNLSITSVQGPIALVAGTSGTWTVNAVDNATGNLRYSVKWGDEGVLPLAIFGTQNITQSSAGFTHTYQRAGTFTPVFTVVDGTGNTVSESASAVTVSSRGNPNPNPIAHLQITSISPGAGPVGTVVTLSGNGFVSNSVVYMGSTIPVSSVSVASDSSLSFTVPSVNAGTYSVWVRNGNGTSNSVRFQVTTDGGTGTPVPTNGSVSINGIDAPTTLLVGQNGTWTVHANSNASSNLHYTVNWGDQGVTANALVANQATTQSSATFTHVYQNTGSYAPMFTVSDDSGHSSTVSASVIVTNQ